MSQGRPPMFRTRFLIDLVFAFALIIPPMAFPAYPADVPTRPDIILIVIDALRADRLGVYGNGDDHTPLIDRFAESGLVFEETIAQAPWTQPSIASLFCAYYPGVHKVLDYNQMIDSTYYGAKKVAVLSDSFVTLAQALQAHGYETAAFVANPFLKPAYGFAQGFDHYDDRFAKTTTPGDVVSEAATAWLASRKEEKPFFLYLHYMDVHGPYNASPKILDPLLDLVESLPGKRRLTTEDLLKLDYLRRPPAIHTDPERHVRLMRYREYWEARYNACVREMDRHFAELVEELKNLGVWEDALTILTADHGEELFEHGYWDHGHSLHHTQLHVPLVFRWKGRIESNGRISKRVRLFDLMPTLLDLLEIPHWLEFQGKSFAATLRSPDEFEETPAYAEGVKVGPEQKAIYNGEWKAIQIPELGEATLYRIDRDPYEKENLAASRPRLLEERLEEIAAQDRENRKGAESVTVENVDLDPEDIERFRRLGYLR